MKQSLGVTLAGLQGLGTTDDSRERPVDRLGALATAQCARGRHAAQMSFLCALGGDLIAFKYGNRAPSRGDAELRLSIALADPYPKMRAPKRDRIARQAVKEYCLDFCMACRGAREVPNTADRDGAQPMKPCGECGSSGLRRYSDAERIEALGSNLYEEMMEAHRLLTWAEALAVRLVKERLERF